ncbi:MAG: choice-of-anchor D domain-containing protein [bacterium]
MAPIPRTPRLLAVLALLTTLAVPAHALRFVNMNLLNYPGTTGATRDPLFRQILQPLAPDLVVGCEISSAAGATQFLNSLNTLEPGQWATGTFDKRTGDTGSQLYYKTSKLQLLGQWNFMPNPAQPLRVIHVYRMKLVGYASEAAEFRVYALHLKASTGFETQRLGECTGLRDTLNALPPGTHALVCGDFNFYTGLEPGMQRLVASLADDDGRLYDPLGLANVTWQDNTSIAYAWTQSPCKTGDTGCGPGAATGGIDDRFDLILPTYAWRDSAGLELVAGTYKAVGNDGLHHNNSIQDPPTIPEGAAYATALHATSDHLPVRVDLRVPARGALDASPIAFGTVLVGAGLGTTRTVSNLADSPGETLRWQWTAPAGWSAPAGARSAVPGGSSVEAIALDTGTPGVRNGTLTLTGNSLDSPVVNVAVSATVLAHAVPSLDSLVASGSATLDLGAHPLGGFTPAAVRVHNPGYGALQARALVSSAAITGGAGRFSVSGAVPRLVAGTGEGFTVAFADSGATLDSTYTATLTFAVGDEALPGATSAAPLTVALQARRLPSATTDAGPQLPVATRLRAPTPNPLLSESVLRFELARAGETRLEVYDAAGRRVAGLLRTTLEPGRYSVRWDGRGESGAPLGAGVYFARLVAPDASRTVRIAIVR